MKKVSFAILIGLLVLALPAHGAIDLVHQFAPSNIHGFFPYGDLVSDGDYYYGMASGLGATNGGTIFRINGDGSGFLVLHAFPGFGAGGRRPFGSLILSGTTLYGMTAFGGDASENGIIFKIETAGTGFTVLHEFAGGAADGSAPYGTLLISGSTLYGMTSAGGDSDMGTIFKLGVSGSGFTLLHEFAGGADDGSYPQQGSLILSGTTLYGLTFNGGDSDGGTIFKIGTDGGVFTLLHEFAGGADDGAYPYGSLVISGTTLYGMTYNGGDSDYGTIFKIGTAGTGFTLLHEFAGGADDGAYTYGSLIISGTTLYGMTETGGDSDAGTVFKTEIDGTGFTLLHEFTGDVDDGSYPEGSLILSGTTIYGMTCNGGDSDFGTIFKLGTAGSGFTLLHEFTGVIGTEGSNPRCTPVLSGTTLYGMTTNGGAFNRGTLFKVETNGGGYTLLHEFVGGSADGARPQYGSLIISGTTLYGMTLSGGGHASGTIFKIGIDGSGFTLLHKFTGGVNDGKNPYGSLILSGTTLYGMTRNGGDNDKGTIFKMQIDGNGFTLLREFGGGADDGAYPYGSLILADTTLYGMTYSGGDNNRGTVFKIGTAGGDFTLLHEFAGGAADGAYPYGSLILSGATLYGMTYSGGDNIKGTVFKISTVGGGFTLLHEFSLGAVDGAYPYGDLLISGANLFGMTNQGPGAGVCGTIFKVGTDGTGFTLLHEFAINAANGRYPYGSLILSNNTFFGTTGSGGNSSAGIVFSMTLPGITVTAPDGGENWNSGDAHDITWSSTGTITNVNIDYSTSSGGNWTSVAANTANDGTYAWTVPATLSTTCLVRISDAANAATNDVSDGLFSISSAAAETLSTPNQPEGAASGLKAASYSFSTGGSTSNLGDAVQYKIDWDDGTDSGWLASGTTSASHSWTVNGAYDVRAMARCATHTTIESLWSGAHALIISDDGTSGKYNSPAQRKILPEVIWASATGGGTWMSEVQVTDISGGSQVWVYYDTAAGRRGPFLLGTNSGGAFVSGKFPNMLQTIDGLDSGAFTYEGTVGAVEFVTQDAAHVLQVTARTLNGNYSKTFPAFSTHDSNTADTSRVMIIPNLTNNSTYRSTCGMFNPTTAAVTVELKLLASDNTQIGTTITRTLSGYGFSAFSPFNEAGVAYPANSYDNVILEIQPISGTGKVLCFGASANNATNDPAAHIAVQNSAAHDNGPSSLQILPEAIWAAATGGGTWMSEAQIVDVSGGSAVSVYFDYGGGNRRGPFALWLGSGAGTKVKYTNILQQIETIDSGFSYYGRVGTVEFQTQDNAHTIQVTARTLNGNYSKTFPGLNRVDAETADTSRVMIIQNYTSNSTYRSTCGFYNPTSDALTVEFTLLKGEGEQIGAKFSKTFVGYDFQAFNPFIEAGVPYPANSYDNVTLRVWPTSGTGQIICFGASANNASNDPAAHLAVQGQ